MPRIPEGPDKYLNTLTAARADAKPSALVNATALARATGATWRIVERWILADDAFPLVQRGGMGTPWQFDLAKSLDHLISRARTLQAGRGARQAEVARRSGFEVAGGVTPSPPVDNGPGVAAGLAVDRRSDAMALKSMAEAKMTTHRLKVMQGEYLRTDLVVALLGDIMTTMQTETLAISAKLDPAGQWPVDLRQNVEDELRTTLVNVRDRLDAAMARWSSNG